MRNLILLFFVLFNLPFLAQSTPWQRQIVSYDRYQYNGGFQNWMIAQSENGWIYCANSDGLLEFDGVNWSVYPFGKGVIRSIKMIDQKIYIGSSSEFGYAEYDSKGFLKYKSLVDKTVDWGGEVWNILSDSNQIYFVSDYYVHILNKQQNTIQLIRLDNKIDCSTLINGILYVASMEGIFSVNDNKSLSIVALPSQLAGHKIVSILPYDNQLLITTAKYGLYLLNDSGIQKISSIADTFIKGNQLFSTSISGTRVALGSVQNGVFIFDLLDPTYKEEFNLNNGLKNNTILNSYFDRDANLWLALDKGLAFVNFNSSIRPMFSTISPIGTGYCSQMYNGTLYLGTNQGLYRFDKEGKYKLIEGTEGQIWSMNTIDNSLFCSGDNGITVISPHGMYKIEIPGVWETQQTRVNKNKLLVGTYSGLYVLTKEREKWRFSHKVSGSFESSKGFMEDDVDNTFWIANNNIQKVVLSKEFDRVIDIKDYFFINTEVGRNTYFRKIDNNLVFCAKDGIYQYSRITDNFNHYPQLESMLAGAKYYEYMDIDALKNIWFVSDKSLKLLPYNSTGYGSNAISVGLKNELVTNYENIILVDTAMAIVSVDNAFVKINLEKQNQTRKPINIHIRKFVSVKNDSTICFGNNQDVIELPYSLNSISIQLTATDFSQQSEIQYSYKLTNVDDEWSIPTANNTKEYTNLPEGKYTFMAKAIINGEYESANIATFEFTILPPWYRSIYAYMAYFIMASILLYILYRKTIRKQKKIIHEKGKELIAQTERFEAESKLKDQEIYELQNENLQAELRYKRQELSGYALNILQKNEILKDVKKNAMEISKAIDEDNQTTNIKQKIVRLIGKINSNLENDSDFEIFISNFDLVHKDFFKSLDEKHPLLSRNDKILCAYLKMNLTSKEIAPLFNISLRGVEVNRYRLRKKMQLDRDVHLSEYLHKM